MLTLEYLKSRLDYDPETGIFIWKDGWSKGRAAGHHTARGYIAICLNYRLYFAHRLAWLYVHGSFPPIVIDHINGITTDNRIANLRPATVSENQQNRRRASANSRTGILGVKPEGKRFSASIKINQKRIHLGMFNTKEEAHAAYLEAKRELHPFAVFEP